MTRLVQPSAVRYLRGTREACLRLAVPEPEGLMEDGWRVVVGASSVALAGPGDGLLVLRLGAEVPAGWDELVERRGGLTVLFGAGWASGRFVELAA